MQSFISIHFHIGSPSGAPLLQPPIVINSTTVIILWEEVNCTQRNGIITGYSIQYHTDKEPQQPTVLNVSRVTNAILTELTNHYLYSVSLAAINTNGIGPYSQALHFSTS